MMSLKLKYIASVSPFVLLLLGFGGWMLWDFVDIQKTDEAYIYRAKHNFGLLLLPLCGFCIASGIFIAKLGRLALIPGSLFVGFGLYLGWAGVTLDTSNHQVRVWRDGVYSEWGSAAAPQSVTMDFRELETLSLVTETEEKSEHHWLIGKQKNGDTVRMPVNDLLKVALKRVFAYASIHGIQLEFNDLIETGD